jgi:protein-S-isoprenylcysteine O-methyltransferase Ste14
MSVTNLYIFLAGTICIILFSWFVSLKERRYHGIPRFFAFEGLLLLGLVQQPAWFKDPWAPWHIVSWILLTICTYYVIAAVFFYFRYAAPGRNFENSTKLVTTGIYKYIRHPMYASLLILGWGMFFKAFTPASIGLIILITIAIYFTSIIEEKEMTARFGDEYKEYMKRTKRWIPFVL